MSIPFEIQARIDEIRAQVEAEGAELLDVHFRGGHGRSVIALTVDRPGGITLDECAAINRRVGEWLDQASESYEGTGGEMIRGSYYLEVNSPGADRPMRTEADFNRAAGKDVRVTVRDAQGRVESFFARVQGAREGKVVLIREGAEQPLELAMDAVVKAVRKVQFK